MDLSGLAGTDLHSCRHHHPNGGMESASLPKLQSRGACRRFSRGCPCQPRLLSQWIIPAQRALLARATPWKPRNRSERSKRRPAGRWRLYCRNGGSLRYPHRRLSSAFALQSRRQAGGIISSGLKQMGCLSEDIVAWLGPAISAPVYEVGEEVYVAFAACDPSLTTAFTPTRPRHWLLDLYASTRSILKMQGVHAIYGGHHCTYREPTLFFSHRRDGITGRM